MIACILLHSYTILISAYCVCQCAHIYIAKKEGMWLEKSRAAAWRKLTGLLTLNSALYHQFFKTLGFLHEIFFEEGNWRAYMKISIKTRPSNQFQVVWLDTIESELATKSALQICNWKID